MTKRLIKTTYYLHAYA